MADGSFEGRDFAFTGKDFNRVRKMIHVRAGISLADSKEEMVYSRLARRLRALRMTSFRDYLDSLEQDTQSPEWEEFTNALTTNLTSFFREAHHFDALREHLASLKRDRTLTIWCSAASTGEEPYSLAMTACEAFGSLSPPVRILATDIDTKVLQHAASGIYSMDRIEKLSIERKRQFLLKGRDGMAGKCRVIEPLRKLLVFRPLNLLDRRYDIRGPLDAIFCRNVMIYFDKPTQLDILGRMVPLLADDGLFFAGHSESFFHATHLIRPLGRTIYRPVR